MVSMLAILHAPRPWEGQATGMAEHVAHGDRLAWFGQHHALRRLFAYQLLPAVFGQIFLETGASTSTRSPGIDQHHERGGGDRFRGRGNPEEMVGPHRHRGLAIGVAHGLDPENAGSGGSHQHHGSSEGVAVHERLQSWRLMVMAKRLGHSRPDARGNQPLRLS